MELSHSRKELLKEIAAGHAGRSGSPLIKPGSEDAIQADFIAWVDLYKDKYPALQLLFAIPNAGFASQKQGALRKLTGRRSGVPDICLPVGRCQLIPDSFGKPTGKFAGYIGLWIEFKKPAERPRSEQRDWHERLRAAGHRVEVLTSWVDAANLVIDYLNLPLERLK